MAVYGKTWWGKKWLDTFNDIENSNRLPRGKTYANTGRASDIVIQGSTVKAKVKGSRPHPYKVEVTLQEFDKVDQKNIQEIITSSPLILSSLINKTLPEQLFQKCSDAQIKLFPSSWKEIEAHCSCPDYAVPCKHIAAVIYLICNQIDQNPFILFTIHNCDLLNLIGDYKDGRLQEIQQLKKVEDLFFLNKSEKHESTFNKEIVENISFSGIQNLFAPIMTILSDNPPFFDKDFKEIFGTIYKHWQNHASYNQKSKIRYALAKTDKESDAEALFLKEWDYPEQYNNFDLVVTKEYKLDAICDGNTKLFKTSKNLQSDLISFLGDMPNSILHKLCPKIYFMHMVYQFSLKLVEKSAIIPQILQNKKGTIFIRWIPALFDESVKSIYDSLCATCPEELLMFESATIAPKEQVKVAISLIISELIYKNFPKTFENLSLKNDVFKLFFMNARLTFNSFSTMELPNSINQWLSSLYLFEKNHKLYLTIEEQGEDFTITPEVILKTKSKPISMSQAIKKAKPDEKLSILSDLSIIGKYIPQLESSINKDTDVVFPLDAFSSLFLNAIPALKAVGVVVLLPKSLHTILKPKINLQLKSKSKINAQQSLLSLEELLYFDWQIALGDTVLSIAEFKKMLKNSRGLIKMMNNYVLMDEKEMELFLKKIEKISSSRLEGGDLLQAMFGEEFDDMTVHLDSQLKSLVKKVQKYEKIAIPTNLHAQLRPYQERGFHWLVQNIKIGFGSILADDMGLGKTIQVITTILHLKNNKFLDKKNNVLIVAPTGLLSNWQKEFAKFAPSLTVHAYHGNKRELTEKSDVVLTSYGVLRNDKKEIHKLEWQLMVVDEAQNIKNPHTKQSKIIKAIPAQHKIAMSGTPVENRMLEYWSIFDFTNKTYLGSLKNFNEQYAGPIEQARDKNVLSRFKKITSPFILRRLKSDKTIIADLPEKIENNQYCSLTKEQAALYQEVVDASIKKIAASDGIERKGLVLQLINALKQICNHPSQFVKKQKDITVDQSGKMLMLEEILAEIDSAGEKCLIFTQYVEMGEILVKLIQEKMHVIVPFLHGGVTRKNRDQMVDEFQNSVNKRIFIISLKAGGTGLNLTAASHVIHYDLWWNPAVENQATDRAYRIGQKHNVMVHRFITTGTFEEKIDEMIKSKKELANLTVAAGENWITEMTTAQIKDLVNLRNV